jgi:hypothetical protein
MDALRQDQHQDRYAHGSTAASTNGTARVPCRSYRPFVLDVALPPNQRLKRRDHNENNRDSILCLEHDFIRNRSGMGKPWQLVHDADFYQ